MNGFRSVIFDCDSTLASVEGIDELAGPWMAEIRVLTDAAMEGSISLEEVYGRRLEIIKPSREDVEALGSLYIDRLVDDARETVAALQWLGKEIRIISGGLRPPVERLAVELSIPVDAVAAVGIDFTADGEYSDFDRTSPLSRSGGKAEVLRDWSLERPALLVGDGATDLEASAEVDLFVAYMGVAFRENVAAGAGVVLTGKSLAPVLALAASVEDREALRASSWSPLLERGEALLAGE